MPFTKGHKINTGRIQTAEHRRNSGLAQRGRIVSSEMRVRISKTLQGNKNALGHIGVLGERNVMWKGNDVSYSGLHHWVALHLGLPRKCEVCQSTTKKKYEWANKDHKYRRVKTDWIRLCTSCHRAYDMQRNGYKVGYLYTEASQRIKAQSLIHRATGQTKK